MKISLTGNIVAFAGQPSVSGSYLDSDISIAKFGYLRGLAVDPTGFFYVSDG